MADLAAPACPHVIVKTQRLPAPYGGEVHGCANEALVEAQVESGHGEERSLDTQQHQYHDIWATVTLENQAHCHPGNQAHCHLAESGPLSPYRIRPTVTREHPGPLSTLSFWARGIRKQLPRDVRYRWAADEPKSSTTDLRDRLRGVHVSHVPLAGLDELRGRVVVGDVQPEAVGDGRGCALPQAEGVPSHKVGAIAVGVVQGVEEVGGGRGEEVLDVLRQRVDLLAAGVLGHL